MRDWVRERPVRWTDQEAASGTLIQGIDAAGTTVSHADGVTTYTSKSETDAQFSQDAVNDYGNDVAQGGKSYVDSIPGVTTSIANVIANHPASVTSAATQFLASGPPTQEGSGANAAWVPTFDSTSLYAALAGIGTDKKAYATVQTSQLDNARQNINNGAQVWAGGGGPGDFYSDLTSSTSALSFLTAAQNTGVAGTHGIGFDTISAGISAVYAAGSAIATVAQPELGVPAAIVGAALGFGLTVGAPDPPDGTPSQASLQGQVSDGAAIAALAGQAMMTNGIAGKVYAPPPPSLLGPNGQLNPKAVTTNTGSLQNWLTSTSGTGLARNPLDGRSSGSGTSSGSPESAIEAGLRNAAFDAGAAKVSR